MLTNLLSAFHEFTKFPHFKNTQLLTRHLIKELIRQRQSSVVRNKPKAQQNKLQLNQFNGRGESLLKIYFGTFLLTPVLFRHLL